MTSFLNICDKFELISLTAENLIIISIHFYVYQVVAEFSYIMNRFCIFQTNVLDENVSQILDKLPTAQIARVILSKTYYVSNSFNSSSK